MEAYEPAWMTVGTRIGLTSLRGCGKDVCCHRFCSNNVFVAAVIRTVLVRFSEDPHILRDLVYPEEDLGKDGVKADLLTRVRTAVWGMLYADDAGTLFMSAKGLAKMMAVLVKYFRSSRLLRIRNENGDHTAADTEPGTPDLTARHGSSGTGV